MNEKFVQRVYSTAVKGNIDIYKDLFNNTNENENTDTYWKNALRLYNSLDAEQRERFFDILKMVITDSVSTLFGIIDGSTTLKGGSLKEGHFQILN